jgi:hypothetical protein
VSCGAFVYGTHYWADAVEAARDVATDGYTTIADMWLWSDGSDDCIIWRDDATHRTRSSGGAL